jgi:hypothetical protein
MPEISKELVALLTFLFPGLLVAAVFYALTSHQKGVQVERVIQAIIFTFIVKCFVAGERVFCEWGALPKFGGRWSANSDLIASATTALLVGLVLSYLVHNDGIHSKLRRWNLSSGSSHPTEWCNVFINYKRYVTLHFKDGRRLEGWPKIWPSDPEKGHFFIMQARWTHNIRTSEMVGTEGLVINVQDIAHVEIMKPAEESTNASPDTAATPDPD